MKKVDFKVGEQYKAPTGEVVEIEKIGSKETVMRVFGLKGVWLFEKLIGPTTNVPHMLNEFTKLTKKVDGPTRLPLASEGRK